VYPAVTKHFVTVCYTNLAMVCCCGCLDVQPVHLLSQLSCDQDRSNNGVPTSRCHLITGITSKGSIESGTYSPDYNKSRCTSCRTDGVFYIWTSLKRQTLLLLYWWKTRFFVWELFKVNVLN